MFINNISEIETAASISNAVQARDRVRAKSILCAVTCPKWPYVLPAEIHFLTVNLSCLCALPAIRSPRHNPIRRAFVRL